MQRKRLYIIELGLTKLYLESKEEAYKVWSILIDSGVKGLGFHSHYPNKGDSQYFYYPESISLNLKSKMMDLHENEAKAQQSMDNYIKAEKMGIIQARKKKQKK